MLEGEVSDLLRFKTRTLTEPGFERSGVWGQETAWQKLEHLGLMFGALAAEPQGVTAGLGLPRDQLTLALLVCPAVWDWYLAWRETRRGFYTRWESEMLLLAAALTRDRTGWLRQSPRLATRLAPVEGLVSEAEIERIRADWGSACDAVHRHTLARAKEIQRVARVHRDPFEPILPVLEAASPLTEYRKITEGPAGAEQTQEGPDGALVPAGEVRQGGREEHAPALLLKNVEENARVGYALIERRTGISQSRIRRALSVLYEHGLVRAQAADAPEDGKNAPHIYRILGI